MNIVFIIGIIESLFFLLIISSKKEKSIADRVFGAWLLVIAINLLVPIFIYTDYLKFIHLNGIDYGLLVLHPIFLYVYTKSLISGKDRIRINYIVHISMFVINFLMVIPYITMDKEAKLSFLFRSEFPVIVWIGTLWVNIIFLAYLFVTSKIILRHQKNVKHHYSYTKHVNLGWLKYLTIGLIVVYFIGSVIGAVLCFLGVSLYYINFYVYSTLVVFLFGLGFFGIKQKNVFTSNSVQEKNTSEKPATVTKQDEMFANKLKGYMAEQKPYLNEKLTILELADSLDVKSYYISFILNKVINKKFYDFVNNYRVEEVKKRIGGGELSRFTLLSIALDCGFNSKASFNRIFKSITGTSPTEYFQSFSDINRNA